MRTGCLLFFLFSNARELEIFKNFFAASTENFLKQQKYSMSNLNMVRFELPQQINVFSLYLRHFSIKMAHSFNCASLLWLRSISLNLTFWEPFSLTSAHSTFSPEKLTFFKLVNTKTFLMFWFAAFFSVFGLKDPIY